MTIRANLPTAADLNQEAHPGGGTQVFDASAEGLVEDLFEAHLRHLDVATKNVIIQRLAAAADSLDANGARSAADALDLLIVMAAPQSEEISPDISEAFRLIGIMKSLISGVDQKDIENFAAGKLHDELKADVMSIAKLISANDFGAAAVQVAMLEQKLLRLSIGDDLAEAFGGGDALWGYITRDKVTEAKKFLITTSMLKKKIYEIVQHGARGVDSGSGSRAKTEDGPAVDPDHKRMVDAVASSVNNLYLRIMSIEKDSDNLKSSDPQRYANLDRAISAIPNVSRTYDIVHLQDLYNGKNDKYTVAPETLAKHARTVALVAPIVAQIEAIDY